MKFVRKFIAALYIMAQLETKDAHVEQTLKNIQPNSRVLCS